MAETEIKRVVKIETKQGERTVKGLRNEIKSLQDALLNIDSATEEYTATLNKLLKDQKDLASVLQAGKDGADNLEGSYNALQAEMSALRKVWKATNDESQRSQIGKRINEINERLKAFDKTIGNSQRNVGNYQDAIENVFGESPRQLIRKYTEQLARMDDTTEEYAKTAVKLAEAQKRVADAQEMAKFSSRDYGDRLDTIAKTGANLASIFGSVKGVMALFGAESETLTKSMYRLQGVMAIVQGLQGLDGIGKTIRGLKNSFGSLTTMVGLFVKSLTGIKGALAASGIGALLAGAGTLIANWDKVTSYFNGGNYQATASSRGAASTKAASKADIINAELDRMLNSGRGTERTGSRDRLSFILGRDVSDRDFEKTMRDLSSKVYRQGYLEGLKEERTRIANELTNATNERTILSGLKAKAGWGAYTKELDENYRKIQELKQQLALLDEEIGKTPESGLGMTLSALEDKINLYDEFTDEMQKIEAEHNRRMEALAGGPEDAIRKEQERYDKELADYRKKKSDEAKARTEEEQRRLEEARKKRTETWDRYVADIKDRAEQAARYEEEIRQADLAAMGDYLGNTEKPPMRTPDSTGEFDPSRMKIEDWKKSLAFNQNMYEEGVKDDNAKRREAIYHLYIQYDILSGNGEEGGAASVLGEINSLNDAIMEADNSVTELKLQNNDRVKAAQEALAKWEKTKTQERIQQAVSASQSVATIIGSIGLMFDQESEEGFEAYKGFMLAQNAINTVASATAAYNSQAAIPIVGPALGALAAAAALASGIANSVQIANQKFGQATPVSNAYSGASVSAPEIAAWNPNYDRNILSDTETDNLYNKDMWVSVRDINAVQGSVKVTDRNSKF